MRKQTLTRQIVLGLSTTSLLTMLSIILPNEQVAAAENEIEV